MASRYGRLLQTLGLVVVAAVLGFLGRAALDWMVTVTPHYAETIERFGGWLVGMVIVVVVIVPMARIHGFLGRDRDSHQ